MTNPNIRIKRSAVPGKRPSNSQIELGELALNTNDGRLFTKKENVGIGTTVTLLNVWTENVGGGAYYNDGAIGIGTSIPTSLLELYTSDGNIKLGDITAQPTTDVGISFSGLGTYTSAIFTELDGQILSYGINTPQIQNPRNTGRVGGIFRLDSRPPGGLGDSSCFVIKYAPVGFATTAGDPENGIKNGLILSLQDGKTYLVPDEGNVLVGLKTDTGTLNQKLQVLGGAYISGNIGVGTTNPIQQVQVGGIGTNTGLVISGFGSIGITTNNPTTYIDITSNTPTRNTVQFGSFGIQSFNNVNGSLSNNGYWDGEKWIYRRNGFSSLLQFFDGNIWLRTLPVGTAGSSGNIDTRIAVQNNGNIGINTDNPRIRLQIGDFNSPSIVGITSLGLVGIGTTNPTSRLQVQGDALITGVVTATTFIGALSGTATSTVNIPNLTGDVTSNNTVTTLATVNSNVGTFGGTGAIPVVTVNGKGLVTGVTTVAPNNGTLTLSVSGTGLSGSSTFTANQAGNSTFTVTSNATSDNTNSTIVSRNGSGGFVAGVVTATQFSTGSGNVAIGTNIITGPSEITIDPAAVGDNTGAVRIRGDLYVDGTQTIINSSTIELADFNVGIATTVGTNLLLDGAGIGIGASSIRKTITWNNSASALTSSEDWNLVSGKQYEINGTSVLSSTTLGSGVVNSSLTSVGTLNNLNVSGITTSLSGFVGNLTGNLNSSGINTATTISGTTLNYTSGSITNISGANLNYTGISTVTNVRSTTLNNTGVGTITTLNSTTSTITNLSGTNVSYSGVGTVGSLNIGSTQVISSGRQLQNIASLDATTTATIETAIANAPNTFTDLQVTGLSTFTNGPVLIGSGTSTGTPSQLLQINTGAYINGNLGIGTTNPTSKLHVVGDVLVSGVITSTDYNSASDINLKENIKPISDPIDKVMNITGVSFNWKSGGKSSMGVIAQEIEKVMPEIVSGDDSKTVNYNGLIGLLIEVVKEQQKEINTLKEKIK